MSFTENGVDITQYFAKITDYSLYVNFPGAQAAGNNSYGQLAQGNNTHYSSPVTVTTPSYGWIDVSILRNGVTTNLIDQNNQAWAAGAIFDTTNRSTPTQLGIGLDSWSQVSVTGAATGATSAIKSNGTLWMWGYGGTWALGNGGTTSYSSPIQVGASSAWTNVATGFANPGDFSIAVQSNGTLWSWGFSLPGALGLNSSQFVSTPVQIGSLNNWTKVAAGLNFSLAVNSQGQLYSWGANSFGQLGQNDIVNHYVPAQLGRVLRWNSVAAGYYHTAAILSDGTLWTWGYNNFGQLGTGNTTSQSSPTQINSGNIWSQIAGGQYHTVALTSSGTLWAWGYNTSGQLGLNTSTISFSTPIQVGTTSTWTQLTAGQNFSLLVNSDGTLWGMGSNAYGQLGLNNQVNSSVPVQLGTAVNSWSLTAMGTWHALAIRADGTLWAWGNNNAGQLGLIDTTNRSSPVQVGASLWSKVSTTKFGRFGLTPDYTLGIQSNGTLWAWGSNQLYGLGLGLPNNTNVSSPIQVGSASNWSQISTANRFAAAVKSDGTLWAWGINSWGQLGQGDLTARSTPVQVGNLSNWSQVACGYYGPVLAIKTDNTLWVWGQYAGQYGLNTTTSNLVSPVQLGTLSNWAQVDVGPSAAFAVKTDSTLWYIGGGDVYGESGLNSGSPGSSPVQIGTQSNWNKVSVGMYEVGAVKTDGTAWAWGYNSTGGLGLGDQTNRSTPAQLGSLSNWSQVSCGYNLTAYTRTTGVVWISGNNSYGQLGTFGSQTQLPISYFGQRSPIQLGSGLVSNVSQIAAGGFHTVAIQSNGTLWAWGNNSFGQLGLGGVTYNTYPVVNPTQVSTSTAWTDSAAGAYHTVAINSSSLYAWGNNSYGQLGQGNNTHYSSPIQVGAATNWSQVNCGYYNTVALQSNGTLWAWGLNSFGQLGTSDQVSYSLPVQVGTLSTWTQASAGFAYSAAIYSGGTLYEWGNNSWGQLGQVNNTHYSNPVTVGNTTFTNNYWTQIAAGGFHTAALQSNGTLWTWGANTYGQLGSSNTTSRSSPAQVGAATNWSQVACGYQHTVATQSNGTLWVCGYNAQGQLGNNNTTSYSSLVQIGTLSITAIWSQLGGGINHSSGIQSNGTLWTWGLNSWGQLGQNNQISLSSPVQVGALSAWTAVSDGYYHTAAIYSGGTLWTWGSNSWGQLGTNTTTLSSILSPVQVTALASVWTQVAGGQYHTVAINSGGLWTWGNNSFGQLGSSNNTHRSSPAQVGALTAWVAVAAGYSHSAAIYSGGTLWTWGSNTYGHLGVSTTTFRLSPTQVGSLSNWTAVTTGQYHTAAINSGNLWTWGGNSYGQLGQNDLTHRSSPVQITVPATSGWTQVFAGDRHTVAIYSGGTLWTWGLNSFGQLGTSNQTNYSTPTQVGSLSAWTKLPTGGIGGLFSEAIYSGGTLYEWGVNSYGQLGQNNQTSYSSPVQVGANTVTYWSSKFAAGGYHTAALQSNGTLWAWGLGSSGQIGNNSTTNILTPVQVGSVSNWSQVSAGGSITTAINSVGSLYLWGNNAFGQLGFGTAYNGVTTRNPTLVLQGNFNRVTSSYSQPYYQSNIDGTLVQLGYADIPDIDPSNSIVWKSFDTGNYHFVGVQSNGTAWSMGNNSYGQLGLGDQTYRSSLTQIGASSNWSRAICADYGTMLIDNSLNGWVVGKNDQYQLGLSDTTNRSSPVQITGFQVSSASMDDVGVWVVDTNNNLWESGAYNNNYWGNTVRTQFLSPLQVTTRLDWTKIYPQSSYTLLINSDGTLWGCGNNSYGALGISAGPSYIYSPTQIGSMNNWASCATGGFAIGLAIKTDGTLWSWGFLSNGAAGTNTSTSFSSPVQVGSDTNWRQVAVVFNNSTNNFAGALKTDGTLWTWGNGGLGGLGNNSTNVTSSPTQVGASTDWNYLSYGQYHAYAQKTNGTLWAWGYNNVGQLGLSDTTDRSSPVQVGTLSNWTTKISAGYTHTAAIKTDGTLWTWGNNALSQLGNNSTSSFSSPAQVGTASNWSQVSSGYYHTLAIQSNGTLWAWGANQYGQLGLSDTTARSSPVQVGTSSNWAMIASGAYQSYAINSSRIFYVWGNNTWGQLADYQAAPYFQQKSVTNDIWSSVATNKDSTVFTKTDGTIWSVGTNSFGALGIGSTAAQSSPVQIGSINTAVKVETKANSTVFLFK